MKNSDIILRETYFQTFSDMKFTTIEPHPLQHGKFIMGNEPVNTLPDKKDGIYFIQHNHVGVHESVATEEQKKTSIAIGVKMGEKLASVVLHDCADGEEIALTTKECGSKEFFRNNFIDAISDWNGIANTNDMRDFLNPKIDLSDKRYIPAVGELHLILLNIKAVNKALVEVGGDKIKQDWYWSSTEVSSNGAWGVYFLSGDTSNYNNKYNYLAVRPSVAYSI